MKWSITGFNFSKTKHTHARATHSELASIFDEFHEPNCTSFICIFLERKRKPKANICFSLRSDNKKWHCTHCAPQILFQEKANRKKTHTRNNCHKQPVAISLCILFTGQKLSRSNFQINHIIKILRFKRMSGATE